MNGELFGALSLVLVQARRADKDYSKIPAIIMLPQQLNLAEEDHKLLACTA
jgi:hypothetical protein